MDQRPFGMGERRVQQARRQIKAILKHMIE